MGEQDERAKILIVDDEKVNIDVLVGLLKPYYRTIVAKSGEQAFQRLENPSLPDLILLDIMMPGLDGYEVCRKFKNNPATRHIPVIFITSKTDEQDEALGFKVGAVDYITKPFSPLIVWARVKTHIELKRRGDMLERLAGLDGLTGIANRRSFDRFLDEEWRRSLRKGHDISILMLDIDFFKNYNDHYGHPQGDECLKQVAGVIAQAMPRAGDFAARYGGEEFACVLPETDREGALAVAERILHRVRELKIPHAQSKVEPYLTVSIGAATVMAPKVDARAAELVAMGDQALYRAKEEGRNKAVG